MLWSKILSSLRLEVIALVLTGLSITASIVYYANVLSNANKTQRQQLETRQAQLYVYFASQMTSESWADHMLNVMNSTWSNLEEFRKWYNDSPRNQMSWGILINYFENAGVLVRKELLDIDMVATGFAGMTRRSWEKVKPIVVEQRTIWGQPRLASEFEYLYNRLIRYMEENPEYKT